MLICGTLGQAWLGWLVKGGRRVEDQSLVEGKEKIAGYGFKDVQSLSGVYNA